MNLPERWAGVLLHPTSLPGPGATGMIGEAAHRWVDWVAEAGFSAWQVLPLCPPGAGMSPYASWSSMLGSPALIDLQILAEDGLLSPAEASPGSSGDRVDPTQVRSWHLPMLRTAAARLLEQPAHPLAEPFWNWVSGEPWLTEVVRFAARKEAADGAAWWDWPPELRSRDLEVLQQVDARLASRMDAWRVLAFLFDRQWEAVRNRAKERGVVLVGDLPIYVSEDSADCWSRPDLFLLDRRGRATQVAGCPPDFFNEAGQRWGNPMYRWEAHAAERYRWWVLRLRRTLAHVDVVRIDHFRGFSAGWAIPASAPDARSGRWVPAPGEALFATVREALGGLPFIAEDLGQLDDAVHALRATFRLPGIRVLQFGFDGDPNNPHHPDAVDPHTVVYPGTHDNDTSAGWFRALDAPTRQRVVRQLGCDEQSAAHSLVRAALDTRAAGTIVAAQDLLGLGSEARMNLPGTGEDNWLWRLPEDYRTRLAPAPWAAMIAESRR